MPASGRKNAEAANNPAPGGGALRVHPDHPLSPEQLPRLLAGGAPRLEVEIGCGNGHFMVAHCRNHPSSLLIGIEIKKKRCLKALSKIHRHGLSNAFVVHGSAETVLERLPDGRADSFHLYFPDPWPKSRHRRRRFLRWENINLLQRKLKEGGFIFMATDYFDYYLHTKVLFLLQQQLRLSPQTPDESLFRSVFAQRFSQAGKHIRILAAQKTESGDGRINE